VFVSLKNPIEENIKGKICGILLIMANWKK
jgi:hypothetical protein